MNDATQAGLIEQAPKAPEPAPEETKAKGKKEFKPGVPRAEVVDLAAIIRNSKDKAMRDAKDEALVLTAEVVVPGLPTGKLDADGKPEYGLVCRVKRFSGLEEGQLAYKSREGAQVDDPDKFEVPTELSSPEARANWWRDIWKLIYGCMDPTKTVLASIARGKVSTAADFGVKEAIYWMKAEESALVVEPLLQALTILNIYSKGPMESTTELDEFKTMPDVIAHLTTAYKGGYLKDWMTGNPEVVGMVVDNVHMLEEVRLLVLNEEAKSFATMNKDAIKQAIREVINEFYGELPPGPTPEMRLFDEDKPATATAPLVTAPRPQMRIIEPGTGEQGEADEDEDEEDQARRDREINDPEGVAQEDIENIRRTAGPFNVSAADAMSEGA